MFKKNSLKTKFSLFLIAFAILLLGSLLSLWFLSARKRLMKSARQEVTYDMRLFSENLKTELTNSILELSSLQYRSEEVRQAGKSFKEFTSPLKSTLEQFLLSYPQKYDFLVTHFAPQNLFLRSRAVKVFGGQTHVQSDWVKPSTLPEFFASSIGRDSLHWQIKGPDPSSGNHLTYVYLNGGKAQKVSFLAAISSNYLFDRILETLRFPKTVQPTILDSKGIVIYASQESNLNKFIWQIFPSVGSAFRKQIKTSPGYLITSSKIWYWQTFKLPQITVGFAKNLGPDFQELDATAMRMAGLAGLILLLVLVIVQLLAGRMSDTLHEISTVADKVANGDFSQKIQIDRQDELGALVKSFNEMIDRTRKSYQSLQEMNAALQAKIAELTRTRAELSEKQRLAIIGETVSKISHEIQNKIGGVSIWLQNLEMELKDNPAAAMYISEMKTALHSFLEMLTHFKRFYREPQLQKESVEIPPIVDAVIKQFSDEIRAKGLKIVRTEPSVLRPILADPRQLEEAFLNILINAIYYSPPGGTITIDVKAGSEWVVISFSDEGPGVPEEHTRNLFQPFFTTKSSGSGLGLAIADSIVRAHGGKISFKNLPDGGTRFTIQLPFENKIATSSRMKST